jgi:GNAT superfamily N-acetyltransferase
VTGPAAPPAGPPQIRPARPEDEPALHAIGGAATSMAAPPSFAAYLRDGGSFVALVDGAVVGYLLAQPLAYDGDTPLTLWIEAVVVHPAWRRRGIATTLYHALESWARAMGVAGALTRLPGDDPAAQALHRRVGFAPHRDDLLLWRLG